MITGIYKITNTINGKNYIGQSIDIEDRWRKHRTPDKSCLEYPLYRAFKKYGYSNFSFDILEECTREELNDKEIYYIEYYDSFGKSGYNATKGGDSGYHQQIRENTLDFIRKELFKNEKSYKELSDTTGVSYYTISRINTGSSHRVDNLLYPIRDNNTYNKLNLCVKCGTVIDRSATYCKKCVPKKRKVKRPSKEVLVDKLNKGSFSSVAKEYGITDNGIRKWCRDYGISDKSKDYK